MRKLIMLALAGTLVLAGGLAWAQKARVNLRRPNPVIPYDSTDPAPAATTLSAMSAAPPTIQFTANAPGTGSPVAGNSSATVKWTATGGTRGNTWTLSVYANSTTFTGCTTVPASAVSVSCSSATVTGTGATATCESGSNTLSTTSPGTEVASGNEGNTASHNFTVVLAYQFTDSWEFIANTCPLTITYTVNAP